MKLKIILILLLFFITAVIICNFFSTVKLENEALHPESIINLSVPEPSGLHYDSKTKSLWTVSDETSTIYNINLKGEILNTLSVDGLDLEGITIINDSILVTILERERNIVFLNKTGKEIKRYELELKGKLNQGLEGITYNSNKSILYVLNEKNPGLLLAIDSTGSVLSKNILDYASDFSGLCYDEKNDQLWIISDEEEAVFKCTLDGKLLQKYNINIKKIEGITIDFENSKLYLISDSLEKLYVYKLP